MTTTVDPRKAFATAITAALGRYYLADDAFAPEHAAKAATDWRRMAATAIRECWVGMSMRERAIVACGLAGALELQLELDRKREIALELDAEAEAYAEQELAEGGEA